MSIPGSCLWHSVLHYHSVKVFSVWEINLGDTEIVSVKMGWLCSTSAAWEAWSESPVSPGQCGTGFM